MCWPKIDRWPPYSDTGFSSVMFYSLKYLWVIVRLTIVQKYSKVHIIWGQNFMIVELFVFLSVQMPLWILAQYIKASDIHTWSWYQSRPNDVIGTKWVLCKRSLKAKTWNSLGLGGHSVWGRVSRNWKTQSIGLMCLETPPPHTHHT